MDFGLQSVAVDEPFGVEYSILRVCLHKWMLLGLDRETEQRESSKSLDEHHDGVMMSSVRREPPAPDKIR